MKKRWIIVLSVIGILVVAGVAGAYFAMDYGVKRALDLLADDPVVTTETSQQEDIQPMDVQPTDSEQPAEHEAEPPIDPASPSTAGTNAMQESQDLTETENEEETTTIPAPSAEEEEPTAASGYTPNISADRVKEVENEITFTEKTKVTSVLLKSFNASDIRLLTELASGGLTTDEKREAKKLFLERLSPEEYDELIQIAANYGLSQGKSYSESLSHFQE